MQDIKVLGRLIEAMMSPEELEALARQSRMYRTLVSIVDTKSTEQTVLVDDIFRFYQGQIPKEMISSAVTGALVDLREAGLLTDDGVVTAEGLEIARMHKLLMV